MSPAEVLKRLETLGHSDVIARLPGAERGQAGMLGRHARGPFSVIHQDSLLRLLAALSRERGLEADEARGRVLWLLGRDEQARRSLLRPAARGRARALAWLGALECGADPVRAARILDLAVRADPSAPDARLWRAAAALERPGRSTRALADLDRCDAPAQGRALPLILRALALLDARRWKEAAAAASRLIARDEGLPAGWSLRFQARLGQGDLPRAEEDYHQARNRDPDCGGFHHIGGSFRSELPARRDARLARYDELLRRYPGAAILRAERAEALREPGANRFDLSLSEYGALEPHLGRQAWFQAHMSRAEASVLGLKAGLRRLHRACRLFPEGGWLFAWRGETYRRLGNERAAASDFDRAARLQPWYGYARVWHGAALVSLGRWRLARRALDAGLAMEVTYPADGAALDLRSRVKARLGDPVGAVDDRIAAYALDAKHEWLTSRPGRRSAAELRRALRDLERARAARPRHAWTRAWIGQVLLAGGDATRAERALDAALRLDPGHVEARVWRAEARLARGESSQAQRDLRAALSRAPGHWRAAEMQAGLLLSRGRAAQALLILDRCLGGNPSAVRFLGRRAEVLRALGRHAEALEAARQALAMDSGYAEARATLAACELASGRARQALAEADRALTEKPGLELALLVRAMARGALGDAGGQIEDFRSVYRRRPEAFAGASAGMLEALR